MLSTLYMEKAYTGFKVVEITLYWLATLLHAQAVETWSSQLAP